MATLVTSPSSGYPAENDEQRMVACLPDSEYDAYVRAEWNLFEGNPFRTSASIDATKDLKIQRVLDIGCGAGQELLPFLTNHGTVGLALDSAPAVGQAGRQLFAMRHVLGHVAFVRGAAESLPCRSEDIDLIICRLALPYTRNRQALSEMSRVLRPGGLILLKFHHARYYVDKLRKAFAVRDARSFIHATRVLAAGTLYHLTGRQPRIPFMGTECFQTEGLLRRELLRHGLIIRGSMPDSTPRTPSLVLAKLAAQELGIGRVSRGA
jgi:SAM-dependent methyltransferase